MADDEGQVLRGLRAALGLTVLLTAAALATIVEAGRRIGAFPGSRRYLLAVGLASAGLLAELIVMVAAFGPQRRILLRLIEALESWLRRRRGLSRVLLVAEALVFPLLTLGPIGRYVQAFPVRLLAFWFLAVSGAALLRAARPGTSWLGGLAASSVGFGVVQTIASYIPDVSTYPFTLAWSEGSRYFYASLFFARRVYGQALPLPVLHPSRYLLQSVPFAFGELPIWAHRLWQVLLWLGLAATGGVGLSRRLPVGRPAVHWFVAGWAFLFFFQGPVYYHLMVCVILVLLGFDRRRFWQTLSVVLIASVWAGISRINWFPVPGLLAAGLYLLEAPVAGNGGWVRYLTRPVLWAAAGAAAAAGTSVVYAAISGNQLSEFSSSFTSDLLWYRLLPSPTYELGVLTGSLLITVPMLALWVGGMRGVQRLHPLRVLGLSGILAVLFLGGLLVSTKIGGGGNLHNMDAYLVLLLVVGAYAAGGGMAPEAPPEAARARPAGWALAAAVAIPVAFAVSAGGPLPKHDWAAAAADLQQMRQAVTQAGGPVLFLTERQLLTFHMLGDVHLEPDYEKVFLMEMAMSRNGPYLEGLYERLRRGAYALIVSEPLDLKHQGASHSFGEENDAWNERVAAPLLRYYHPILRLDEVNVWLMAPNGG